MRLRIRFSKLGKVRWTSHRDLARMWERAFRRVELPVAYSGGFTPRPRVSFGFALPTGYESLAEYLDVEVNDEVPLEVGGLAQRLSAALPSGVDANEVACIDDHAPSLQQQVTSCTWQWVADSAPGVASPTEAELAERVASLLSSQSMTVRHVRKGVEVVEDIRGAVIGLATRGRATTSPGSCSAEGQAASGVWLEAELACQPRSLRPSDLLPALGSDLEERQTRRLAQWILRDGARCEPLPSGSSLGATAAPHAWKRAS